MLDIWYSRFKKLNSSKKQYILLILLISTFLVQFIIIYKNNKYKKVEEELNNKSDTIENCLDIENKYKRTIFENLKLSEYCIEKFGSNKWF